MNWLQRPVDVDQPARERRAFERLCGLPPPRAHVLAQPGIVQQVYHVPRQRIGRRRNKHSAFPFAHGVADPAGINRHHWGPRRHRFNYDKSLSFGLRAEDKYISSGQALQRLFVRLHPRENCSGTQVEFLGQSSKSSLFGPPSHDEQDSIPSRSDARKCP